MKIIVSWVITVFVVAYIRMICDEQEKDVWVLAWEYLKPFILNCDSHPDSGLNIYQFLEKYHYPLEYYDVVTEDDYILTLHRIPHGRNDTTEENDLKNITRPAVLLVHCLACSAMDWIWQGPNISLALNLADTGYDVWLANTRGNAHCLQHKTLTTKDPSFWDFSFHEKGYYDIPATIDFILNVTKEEKITYIGHSQGTSEALVMTSSRPEYNEKLNLLILLSPVAYMKHISSPAVKFLVEYNSALKMVLRFFGIYGLEYNPYISFLANNFCSESSYLQDLCIYLIGTFAGYDCDQVDRAKLTVFLTNTPSGLSYKDMEHYIQETNSGFFRQYDHGNDIINFLHYGQSEPPSYNLSHVTAPLAIYYAKNDFLSNSADVEKLLSELRADVVDKCLVEYEKFNHLDFITAKDVKSLLYDRVIKIIQRKNPTRR